MAMGARHSIPSELKLPIIKEVVTEARMSDGPHRAAKGLRHGHGINAHGPEEQDRGARQHKTRCRIYGFRNILKSHFLSQAQNFTSNMLLL